MTVFEPEQVLLAATDGTNHIAARAAIERPDDGPAGLADWEEVTPGDQAATFAVNLLRSAMGGDTLTEHPGALEELSMIRRALDGFLRRVDQEGHLRVQDGVLDADRLGLVELARDALDLATSRGRADKEVDAGLTLKRVPSPRADRT